ncbi:hypothetical protein CBS101457_001149 [Exobasidium rhododendri]|nr:hypothetical protein CBS101457_001149 [Exobasidium rhododendri]
MSSKVTATLAAEELPLLPLIDAAQRKTSTAAVKCIHSESDVVLWRKSAAHKVITLFLARLCESAVGKGTQRRVRGVNESLPKDKGKLFLDGVWDLLDELQHWTEEIEPLKSPQRFGNLAFRSWGQRLEERVTALHRQLLPSTLHPVIPELETYFLGGFGSWIRLDYGSGHELSFLAWLCFLARLGMFLPEDGEILAAKSEERIALEIIPKYLEVVWGLQDRYGLEPAGSHGVWGLDDYQFIPYAIGAAQLRNQSSYLPSAISLANHKPDPPKLPIDRLLQFIPGPSDSSSRRSASTGEPPFANLYTTSIARIHSLKRGPFSEHSPLLYDVSLTVPNWVKVHSGMMKMWEAECLNKLPVIQHFPFGAIAFIWEGGSKSVQAEGATTASQTHSALPMTAAPWKAVGSIPSPMGGISRLGNGMPMPATGAPWKTNSSSAIPTTRAVIPPAFEARSMASTGSAAAASSPFGNLSKPSVPSRSRKE